MLDFPSEWRVLVNTIVFYESRADVAPAVPLAGAPLQSSQVGFSCPDCHERFPNRRALTSHMRVKHKSRDIGVRHLVGADAKCPVCKTTFSTRIRCIAHLSERRIRRGRIPCRSRLPDLPPTEQQLLDTAELDALDLEERRAARKRGHITPLSRGLPKRARVDHCPPVPDLGALTIAAAVVCSAPQAKRRRLRGKGPPTREVPRLA